MDSKICIIFTLLLFWHFPLKEFLQRNVTDFGFVQVVLNITGRHLDITFVPFAIRFSAKFVFYQTTYESRMRIGTGVIGGGMCGFLLLYRCSEFWYARCDMTIHQTTFGRNFGLAKKSFPRRTELWTKNGN